MRNIKRTVGRGRRAATRLFVDQCIVRRPDPNIGTFNPTTGAVSIPVGSIVYSGACHLRKSNDPLGGTDRISAHKNITVRNYQLEIPWNATPLQVNDVVTVTSSDDAHLVGRKLRVTKVHQNSTLIVRRMTVEDVDNG
jgi:hypothetical protein